MGKPAGFSVGTDSFLAPISTQRGLVKLIRGTEFVLSMGKRTHLVITIAVHEFLAQPSLLEVRFGTKILESVGIIALFLKALSFLKQRTNFGFL